MDGKSLRASEQTISLPRLQDSDEAPPSDEDEKDEQGKRKPAFDLYGFGPIGVAGRIRGARLIVHELHEGGPADGKLQLWDEITTVNGRSLGTNPHLALARIIAREESTLTQRNEAGEDLPASKTFELALRVLRDADYLDVTLELPRIGSREGFPSRDVHWDKVLTTAEDWLAARQRPTGTWYADNFANPFTVTVTASAALVLLNSDRCTQEESELFPKVQRSIRWLREALPLLAQARKGNSAEEGKQSEGDKKQPAPNMNLENWGWCYSAIFLSEYFLATEDKSVADLLKLCAEAIAGNQEKTGGWAHGPGGPNMLGYQEFNAVTYHALIALGMLKQCGVMVDEKAVTRGQDYIEASNGKTHGVGYSHIKPGDVKGSRYGYAQPGRTAGVVLAYRLLQSRPKPQINMLGYVKKHLRRIKEGHASAVQHLFVSAALLREADNASWRKLIDDIEDQLTAQRRWDGSFGSLPTPETLRTKSNPDRLYGNGWTTSMIALVYASRAQRLKLFGGDPTKRRAEFAKLMKPSPDDAEKAPSETPEE